jgi:hypothetical protein
MRGEPPGALPDVARAVTWAFALFFPQLLRGEEAEGVLMVTSAAAHQHGADAPRALLTARSMRQLLDDQVKDQSLVNPSG